MKSARTSCVLMVAMVALFLWLAASSALASPVRWSGNGHWYELVEEQLTWEQAKLKAESLTYLGHNGYLATITSECEQWFIQDSVASPLHVTSAWLGGYQPEGSPEPNEGWTWVTGEAWEYTNWYPTQPDNWLTNGEEDWLQIYLFEEGFGLWNDLAKQNELGYIVEYVPEPLTFVLLATGGLSLLLRRR